MITFYCFSAFLLFFNSSLIKNIDKEISILKLAHSMHLICYFIDLS